LISELGVNDVNKIKKEMKQRTVRNFLDLILLAHFNDKSFSGYDSLNFIREKYGILLSSGTVYSTLYKLERKKIIQSNFFEGRRLFRVTDKGKIWLEIALEGTHEFIIIPKNRFHNF